jgi:voltage-gated potassium channel
LVATATAVLETEQILLEGHQSAFRTLEAVFGAVFLIEYVARLWIAVEPPSCQGRSFPRLRYAVSPAAIIDLLAIVPASLFFAGSETFLLRLVRLLRILRIAKLGRLSRAWANLARAVHSRRSELFLTLGLAALAMLLSSTLLYWAEGEAQPDKFGSIPRAFWWAVVTLTTVGYGDVFPITVLGKIFAAAVALSGIGLIALPTSILAAAFSEVMQGARATVRNSDEPEVDDPSEP